MLPPSSGSMTPRSSPEISSTVGERRSARRASRTILPVSPCNLDAVTDDAGRRLDLLKALGDNTRYAIYLELARSPAAAGHRRHRRVARPAPEHRAAPPRADARGRPARGAHRGHAAGSAGRSTSTRWPPTPRRSGSSRRRSRCWPGCSCDWPRRRASRLTTPPRSGGRRAEPTPAATPTRRRASRRWSPSSTCSGFDPAVDGIGRRRDRGHRLRPLPVPRAGRGPPELVCSLHRGMVEGFVEPMGDGEVDDFHTLVHREPCQVTISSR